jgi:hypothetical protein
VTRNRSPLICLGKLRMEFLLPLFVHPLGLHLRETV